MSNKKHIYYITNTYPFGMGEYTFVKPELERLARDYDISLVSCGNDSDNCDAEFLMHHGIELIHFKGENLGPGVKAASFFATFFNEAFWDDLKIICSEKKLFFERIRQLFWFVFEAVLFEKWFLKKGFTDGDSLYYTYWYYSHTLSMALLKKDKRIKRAITRAHGYDVHGFRFKSGRECCKHYMDRVLDHVFFISEEGIDYYRDNEKVTIDDSKHHIAYLGAPRAIKSDEIRLNDNRSDVFRIVSCSGMTAGKRINLIIDALALIDDRKIDWIHFGDGELYDELLKYSEEKLASKSNISYKFAGFVDRDEIYRFYSMNTVNCHVLLSATEGLPVSIMEALANGIPIIVTDVGGCYETIRENGFLVSPESGPKIIQETIEKMVEMSSEEYIKMRVNSFNLWRDKFDVSVNMDKFAHCILDLM